MHAGGLTTLDWCVERNPWKKFSIENNPCYFITVMYSQRRENEHDIFLEENIIYRALNTATLHKKEKVLCNTKGSSLPVKFFLWLVMQSCAGYVIILQLTLKHQRVLHTCVLCLCLIYMLCVYYNTFKLLQKFCYSSITCHKHLSNFQEEFLAF